MFSTSTGRCPSTACAADRDTRQAFLEAQRIIAATTLDAAVQAKAVESKLLELAGVLELREKEVAALRRELAVAKQAREELVQRDAQIAALRAQGHRDSYDAIRPWDMYAAAAIAGLEASPSNLEPAWVARRAVVIANAMVDERKKENET